MDDSTGYYDETIYLDPNCNAKALKEIEEERKKTDGLKLASAIANGYSIKIYDEYINFIAYLIKVLNMPNNAISASMILKSLLESGVFSYNDKFQYIDGRQKEVNGFLGLNVILGHGCCRHVSRFQSDVLGKMNLMSDVLYCHISDKHQDEANKLKANHAMNLIEYHGILYGYDTERNQLFRMHGENEMAGIYIKNPSFVYYKPYIDMLINGMKVENANYMLKLLEMFKDKDIIGSNEYLEILNYVKNIISSNQGLIKDFRHSSKQYTKKIVKNLK